MSEERGSGRFRRHCRLIAAVTARALRPDHLPRFARNGLEIQAPWARATVPAMNQDNDQSFIRWIPVVVPLSALVLVLGVYLVAAEVLERVA